ncbi:MAG: hypothetical protein AMXMBFR20_29610 [Planctomycetia bacterium]
MPSAAGKFQCVHSVMRQSLDNKVPLAVPDLTLSNVTILSVEPLVTIVAQHDSIVIRVVSVIPIDMVNRERAGFPRTA